MMDDISSPPSTRAPSLAALFAEHGEAMYLAAYRISGNAQDAEDVLQSIFLRLLKRSESQDLAPDIGDNPASYLCRAAINASLDLLRAKRP